MIAGVLFLSLIAVGVPLCLSGQVAGGLSPTAQASRTAITLSDLTSVALPKQDAQRVQRWAASQGFKLIANGLFASTQLDKNGKPVSRLEVIDLGPSNMVVLKLSDQRKFQELRKEAEAMQPHSTKTLTDGVRIVHGNHSYNFYPPKGGLNTVTDTYYEVSIHSSELFK